MQILTYDLKKRKQVLAGELEYGMFIKTVQPKYFMKIYNAYGISKDVIDKLMMANCGKIRIRVKGASSYDSQLSDWQSENAIKKNFGHGEQVFLPLKFMKNSEQLEFTE